MTYTPDMIEDARTLRDLGASYREIGRELGIDPKTAQLWLNPKTRERHLRSNRDWRKRNIYVPGTRVSVVLAGRMVKLRERGLSYSAIAGAIAEFTGREVSGSTVAHVLEAHAPHLPKKPRGVPFGAGR